MNIIKEKTKIKSQCCTCTLVSNISIGKWQELWRLNDYGVYIQQTSDVKQCLTRTTKRLHSICIWRFKTKNDLPQSCENPGLNVSPCITLINKEITIKLFFFYFPGFKNTTFIDFKLIFSFLFGHHVHSLPPILILL